MFGCINNETKNIRVYFLFVYNIRYTKSLAKYYFEEEYFDLSWRSPSENPTGQYAPL